jgi:sugar phosphate isomerase/epimerase
MNTVSFITANFVARELDYHMTGGWMEGDAATQAAFRPAETFALRFDTMLGEIQHLGFAAIDLWLAHLHWSWATDAQVADARALLKKRGLQALSLAGGPGNNPDELVRACSLAARMDAPVLAGGMGWLGSRSDEAVAILREHKVRLALENHPEKTPDEIRAKIPNGAEDVVGIALDTGWFATQGFPPAAAIRALKDHLITIHLKDIKGAGAHETCALGDGVADIPACVAAIREVGFEGPIGIEHEPETFDPTRDVRQSLRRLEQWMA